MQLTRTEEGEAASCSFSLHLNLLVLWAAVPMRAWSSSSIVSKNPKSYNLLRMVFGQRLLAGVVGASEAIGMAKTLIVLKEWSALGGQIDVEQAITRLHGYGYGYFAWRV